MHKCLSRYIWWYPYSQGWESRALIYFHTHVCWNLREGWCLQFLIYAHSQGAQAITKFLTVDHSQMHLPLPCFLLVPCKSEVIFSQAWSSIFVKNNLRSTQLWFLNLSLPIAHEKLDFTIHSVMCWYSSYSTFKNLIGLACNN
jgi:hypothetical protein